MLEVVVLLPDSDPDPVLLDIITVLIAVAVLEGTLVVTVEVDSATVVVGSDAEVELDAGEVDDEETIDAEEDPDEPPPVMWKANEYSKVFGSASEVRFMPYVAKEPTAPAMVQL